MILDLHVLADLAVAITPKASVRVTSMAHAATPLGAGFGVTRFASRMKAFKVIYLAQDLTTAVAETLVSDRLQGRSRRKLLDVEAALWGATEVNASASMTLIDLRTTGLLRFGVSTEAGRGKAQRQGRKLSQAIYDQTDTQGEHGSRPCGARPRSMATASTSGIWLPASRGCAGGWIMRSASSVTGFRRQRLQQTLHESL